MSELLLTQLENQARSNPGEKILHTHGNNFLEMKVLKGKLGYKWCGVPCSREKALSILDPAPEQTRNKEDQDNG